MLRFRVEAFGAAVLAGIAAMTFFWPDWIEFFFGADPDGGDGSAEWGVVLSLAVASFVVGLLARYDYRRAVHRIASNRIANG